MASIERRVRDGRVSYRVRYRDPAGRQRSTSFARKVDADRFRTEIEHAKNHGAYVDPAAGKLAFGVQAERWFASTAALRPATRRTYRKLLDLYVLPGFAAVPLAGIDTLATREWYAALVGRGLSVGVATKAHIVLVQVLGSAVEAGRLARNAAATFKPPKGQRHEAHFLTAVEVEALAEAITPRYATLIRFASWTGMRPSEYVALRVGRLNLPAGTVRVVEGAPEVEGEADGRAWGPTKTHVARTLRLPRWLCEELAGYLATYRAGRPGRWPRPGLHHAQGRAAAAHPSAHRPLPPSRHRRRAA